MERLEIIEALKHMPDAIEAGVAGVPEEALRRRPSDGEWSVKEVVGHMRDMTQVWHRRLYMVWSQPDPLVSGFDGEASVKEHNYQDANLSKLLTELREQRMATVDLLSHAVDWSRIGQHRELGRRSLKQWAEYVVNHDAVHVEQIKTLVAAAKAPR